MAQLLFVPVNLDALALEHGATVVKPYEAFDQLPYVLENDLVTHRRSDVHAGRANMASDIDADAFSDQTLFLPAGIHLHWTLPQGLTKGIHAPGANGADTVQFPPVPNRWLVVRRRSADQVSWTVTDRWVVESDALFQIDSDPQTGRFPALTPDANGLAAPYKVPVLAETTGPDAPQPHPEPYRYLGRATGFPIATTLNWQPQTADRYLPSLGSKLTAVGYGEPAYAAFFPNCATVFGLYDKTPLDANLNVRYDVFGWHSDAADEALNPAASQFSAFLKFDDTDIIKLLNRFAADGSRPLLPLGATLTAANYGDAFRFWLEENYGWQIPSGSVTGTRNAAGVLTVQANGETLAGILCYSSIILNTNHDVPPPRTFSGPIAVGNTGSEALAAWLASQIAGNTPDAPTIEEQLEAANLAPELNQSQLDLGARFREARHAKGFRPVPGESLWTIRPSGASANGTPPDQVTLPDDLGNQLNALNAAQSALDEATFEVNSRRQRLFSLWQLYMKASYPDNPDFFGSFANDPLIGKTVRHARVNELPALRNAQANRTVLANALTQQLQSTRDSLTAFNANLKTPLVLQPTSGPRYWAPNDPVLFLGGDPLFKAPPRYIPGPVAGQVRPVAHFDRGRVTEAAAAEYLAALDALLSVADAPGLTRHSGSTPAWNPFLLEWEAIVETPDLAGYSADLIKNDQSLTDSLLAFTTPPSPDVFPDPIFRPVRGRTLLKPQSVEISGPLPAALASRLGTLANVKGLAQSLGGFNRALLMHRQAYQLPLADPITFTDPETLTNPADIALFRDAQFRNFTADVMAALGGTDDLDSVEPGYGFYPIHQGRIRLLRLRVVDTFGQVLNCYKPGQSLICSLGLSCGNSEKIGLPVRITQPARLGFRWLSGTDDAVESTDHPATTPVCGWVVPNHLDNSLAVFAADGSALGSLGRSARWRNPPGPDDGSATIAAIPNPHLQELIATLASQGDLSNFLSDLGDAIDNIDPDNFAQHQARALFAGRPLALVRARVQFELRDLPATDQSWADLQNRVNGGPDGDRQFQIVKFPILIGDHSQFNDGVAAYWQENSDGLDGPIFPKDHSNPDNIIWQPLAGGNNPLTLSLLVDPRAGVHASCGILPTKTITIPADQFADALKRIEISFLTAPLLTEPGKTMLPLPTDPELTFFWLQRESAGWSVIPAKPKIQKQDILDAFPANGDAIWNQLAQNGWIALDALGLEGIVQPQPAQGLLPLNGFDAIRDDVKRAIDRLARGIQPLVLDATFGPRPEIREGWLQLTAQF
jgi:hypothetical protein